MANVSKTWFRTVFTGIFGYVEGTTTLQHIYVPFPLSLAERHHARHEARPLSALRPSGVLFLFTISFRFLMT